MGNFLSVPLVAYLRAAEMQLTLYGVTTVITGLTVLFKQPHLIVNALTNHRAVIMLYFVQFFIFKTGHSLRTCVLVLADAAYCCWRPLQHCCRFARKNSRNHWRRNGHRETDRNPVRCESLLSLLTQLLCSVCSDHRRLAQMGATVVVACRNVQSAFVIAAIADIKSGQFLPPCAG